MKTKNTDKKVAKKLDAEKLKKQKAREAKKAKRLALIEKQKAKVEANKKKRAEKKAKKLAKLEKERAKKAALREAKKLARQKKLERIAKQKAKAKELKQKERAKAKLEKQKLAKVDKQNATAIMSDAIENVAINKVVDALKTYIKKLAKDASNLDDKKIKKLEKLGFTFNDETIAFTFETKRKVKKQVAIEPEVVESPKVEPATDVSIDATINEVIDGKTDAIEALAAEIEEDANNATEIPVGDTFTDDATTIDPLADDQPNGFDDEDNDDTIDDSRDELDDDKVDFRRDWNNEFDEDGERDENY